MLQTTGVADAASERVEVRTPSEAALDAAAAIEKRLKLRRAAPLRVTFMRRPATVGPTSSPLAQTLRGGRGGEVRLKLLLAFLWFASAPPYDLTYPARAWATLLDLPDPTGRGVRRVNEAIKWLEGSRFITVENRPGAANRVRLLREDGSGRDYLTPSEAYQTQQAAAGKNAARTAATNPDRYIKIPEAAWTSGWIAVLTPAAVAMFLIQLAELGGGASDTTTLWLSPSRFKERYGLSEDTQTKGLRELRAAGLITVRRQPVSRDVFDAQRRRNVYRLRLDQLNQTASVPTTVPPPVTSSLDLFARSPRRQTQV